MREKKEAKKREYISKSLYIYNIYIYIYLEKLYSHLRFDKLLELSSKDDTKVLTYPPTPHKRSIKHKFHEVKYFSTKY